MKEDNLNKVYKMEKEIEDRNFYSKQKEKFAFTVKEDKPLYFIY